MTDRLLCRCPLIVGTVALLLAGCAAQSPLASGALAPPATSFMRERPASLRGEYDNLIYASDPYGALEYYEYPSGKFVGTISARSPEGLCSDKAGNVFIVDTGAQQVREYAHAGLTPINTLDDSSHPNGCAIDRTTETLAVVGGAEKSPGNVAIYANAQGSPTVYTDDSVERFYYCAFDGRGNLFTEGTDRHRNGTLVELAKGSQSFTPIALNQPLGGGPVAIAWDGTYLDIFVHTKTARPAQIYQVQLSGSTGTVVNTISLRDAGNAARYKRPSKQFWIQGSTILMPKGVKNDIGEWAYPAGGKPKRFFEDPNSAFWGITVSLVHH